MASRSETTDVESLQKRGPHRGRWLDCCLVLSVIVLFAGLAALAAAGVQVVHNLESKLQLQHANPESEMSKVVGSAPDNMFKMLNYAYLEATSSVLGNQTMTMKPVTIRVLKTVGSNYVFNDVQHSLEVKQAGSYFLYVKLNVTCVGRCQPGLLRVQVSDELHCDLHLSSNLQPQQKKCWTVATLKANTSLLLEMSQPHGPSGAWKLELNGGSGFGIFLVG